MYFSVIVTLIGASGPSIASYRGRFTDMADIAEFAETFRRTYGTVRVVIDIAQ